MSLNETLMKARIAELVDAEAEGTATEGDLKEMDSLFDAIAALPVETVE